MLLVPPKCGEFYLNVDVIALSVKALFCFSLRGRVDKYGGLKLTKAGKNDQVTQKYNQTHQEKIILRDKSLKFSVKVFSFISNHFIKKGKLFALLPIN